MAKPQRAAALVLVESAALLHPGEALFEAMLEGWRRQHAARRLSPASSLSASGSSAASPSSPAPGPGNGGPSTSMLWSPRVVGRIQLFGPIRARSPCSWTTCAIPATAGRTSASTGWERSRCRSATRTNRAVHVADYEGSAGRRPFTRDELQALFDVADDAVSEAARSSRKGWLPAFRDATLLKVIYGWGLRRPEAAMLDVEDFSANPAAPELGRFGMLAVRYGKAMAGSPPRRRAVASVMPWAVEVIEQYVNEVRPWHGAPARGPALWLTERGGRISTRRIQERFSEWRQAAELARELSVHCLRHSYASHLVEDGADPLFVQHQLGHSWASTTAVYTTVGADHTNKMLRAALDRAFRSEEGP